MLYEADPYSDPLEAPTDAPRQHARRPAEAWRSWWSAHAESAEEPLRTAARSGFVLTSAGLATVGVSRSRARNEVRHGRWTAAGRGLLAPLDVRDADQAEDRWEPRRRHALRCGGATLTRPSGVVTGRSSAVLHGVPTLRVPALPELTEHNDWGGRRRAAHLYTATLDSGETTLWHGVRLETIERTLVTLARHGRRDAIMAADAALREELTDFTRIARALDTAFGWPWVRQAREVLALADPLAESPLESITRLALHDSGFPPPRLQVWFGADRVDFYWPRYGLVLEADGRSKYVGDASWREKQRDRRLLRQPSVRAVEHVIWSDVMTGWRETSATLWEYFR